MEGLSRRRTQLLGEAWRELVSSKLNLFFMAFGLVVGVAAMTSIHSLGRGTQVAIIQILENLNFGSNAFLILAGGGKFFGPATTRRDTLTLEDMDVLKRLEFVVQISPVQVGMLQVSSPRNAEVTRVIGAYPIYQRINNWQVKEGRFITPWDLKHRAKVCVLGYETARRFFGGEALGKRLRVRGVYFQVVGVLEKKGVIGRYKLDERVIVPLTTSQKRIFNREWIDAAKILAVKGTDLREAKEVVARILRRRHHIGPGDVDDFRIITPDQIVAFLTRASRTLTALLLVISFITLVVSGVIIMNIMYAIVEEKKRIIALRMALGASPGDIMIHYLAITGGVALVGGVGGYLLGLLIVLVISHFSPISGVYDILFLFPSLLFALVTGLLFGLAPARRASKLPPAELLA